MWLIAPKAIAANIAVIIATFGFGSWIPRFLPDSFSRSTRLLLAMIGGLGLLGLAVFLVGHLSLTRWTIGAILACGALLAALSGRRLLNIRLPFAKLPAAIVGTILSVTAVAGLAEPVGDWGKDGVAYHLLGPKVWLRNAIIRPIPDNMNTSYPSTVEMVFTSLRAIGGDRAPESSQGWTLALLLAIAASLARRCGLSARGAWWVVALIVTMPAVWHGGTFGFVDAIYAAFVLAAIRVGLDAVETKHFCVFGLFCGLAMATKYPALVALPALIVCSLWRRQENLGVRRVIAKTLTAATVACLVASPIYLRNWIFLGTPIYPPPASIAKFLHVKYFPVEAIRSFYNYNIERGKGHGRGLLHFLTLPFNLTYHTADFSGAGGIGLAPLAFGPLGVIALWREPFARRMALASVLLLALWFVTMQESRYLIHFYAVSAIFAVFGWQLAVSITGRRGAVLCAAVVAISVAYGCVMIQRAAVPAAYGVFSPAVARMQHQYGIPFVESFDYVNRNPSVTRLLILDITVPPYYSDKSYVKPAGQWGERVFLDVNTPSDILARLNELGISHVLDVKSIVGDAAGRASGPFAGDYKVPPNYPGLVLVFEQAGQRVYKVVPDQ